MKTLLKQLAAAVAMCAAAAVANAQTQGVSDDEIVLGAVSDLSGIFAAVGVPATQGANFYFDKVNAAGGVHGRKIRYVVEDSGYQMPRAIQAYNKLLNRDKVFAMLQTLGTSINVAGFKLLDPKGIPNISPLSAARQMLQEPMRNKFTSYSDFFDQSRIGVKYLASEFDAKNVCAMYLPTDFGSEVVEGAKAGVRQAGLTYAAETTHKPTENDFVGSLSKLNEADCDIVIMALGVRQVITVVATAKKMGLADTKFLVTSAGFLTVVARAPGGVTEGLYAAASWQDLWARADEPEPKAFIAEYKAATGEDPVGFAMLGAASAAMTVKALEAAGPNLTHDSFIEAMESLHYMDNLVGNRIDYGPNDHKGADPVYVSVVENGSWNKIYEE